VPFVGFSQVPDAHWVFTVHVAFEQVPSAPPLHVPAPIVVQSLVWKQPQLPAVPPVHVKLESPHEVPVFTSGSQVCGVHVPTTPLTPPQTDP
jgi:hypothetical protein